MDDNGEKRLRELVGGLQEKARLQENILSHLIPLIRVWSEEKEEACSAPYIAREFLHTYDVVLGVLGYDKAAGEKGSDTLHKL